MPGGGGTTTSRFSFKGLLSRLLVGIEDLDYPSLPESGVTRPKGVFETGGSGPLTGLLAPPLLCAGAGLHLLKCARVHLQPVPRLFRILTFFVRPQPPHHLLGKQMIFSLLQGTPVIQRDTLSLIMAKG